MRLSTHLQVISVNFDCLVDKLRSTNAACFVDVFGHAVAGNIHPAQLPEELVGAGVVMSGDKALQLGGQRLGVVGTGGSQRIFAWARQLTESLFAGKINETGISLA